MNLIVIKTKNKIYISDDVDDSHYFHSKLGSYLIDGKYPKETYKENWYEIDKFPNKIENKIPPKKINQHYELKDGFQESEMTPKIINESYIDEDSEYYEVKGLYDFKYDLAEETYEEIPFNLHIAEEIDEEFEITKEDFKPQYGLLDRIQTHPVLLPTKPCSLTKKETYNIIRNHIKNNIDPKWAEITSDYDFCLKVKKRIPHETEEYTVDVNVFHKRRKPKYEKRYRRERQVTVFEAAPKPYQSYTVVKPFTGKNVDDLKKNIDDYLNDLMGRINKPLEECSHCNGTGVVENGD